MAISYVNGFLCTCSCDVSKAKRGEDPHPSTDPTKTDSKKDAAAGDARTDGPAVLYGGSLSGPSTAGMTAARLWVLTAVVSSALLAGLDER